MPRGTLITIEGLDGAGKSTLAAELQHELRAVETPVRLLREPGGVEVSERIRALLLDPTLHIAPRAEALLYAAARAQLVSELLQPLLDAGELILLDRFVDSSLAYQGAARSLGIEEIRALNDFATAGLAPDRTLLLRIDPALALARLDGAGDRIEREQERFFAAVAAGYEQIAAREPRRVRTIDATQPAPLVLRDALAEIADLLPGAGPGI